MSSHRAAPVAGLDRLLGRTDRVGWGQPLWQALATGAIFVAVGLVGFHAPHPRHAPLDVAGTPQAARVLGGALDRAVPGGYDVRRAATVEDGLRRLRRGDTLAVVVPGRPGRLLYAGANGPTPTVALTRAVPAVGARAGTPLVPVDALPLRPDDTAGLPLFYLTFGVVLASYLFAVTSSTVGRALPPRGHWTSSGVLALALGVVAALMGHVLTHTLDGPSVPAVAALLALASLATSAVSWVVLRAGGRWGSILASTLLVVLGSAAGGVVPAPFLPPVLAVLRPLVPMGAAFTGIRDVVYFRASDAWVPLVVLVGWVGLALTLDARAHRRA